MVAKVVHRTNCCPARVNSADLRGQINPWYMGFFSHIHEFKVVARLHALLKEGYINNLSVLFSEIFPAHRSSGWSGQLNL